MLRVGGLVAGVAILDVVGRVVAPQSGGSDALGDTGQVGEPVRGRSRGGEDDECVGIIGG